ncbi:site-specific recombinase XerD (plasmid) [Hoeflea sp. IMCC20628]|uniref:tyrosine-type recombinase/integrase n=1 Tax=Hoeflea sp. IMCC20628 TaxID=1620421 RepID=UPI00063AD3EA|nr:tyrosine-type recombinase/integrase [Hoeflea sp. IMCC20628]AKI03285.1 site-specific recombinase XerD [Hoeflea sp. IMCC20628]
MAQIIDQTADIQPDQNSAPQDSTAAGNSVAAPESPVGQQASLPSPVEGLDAGTGSGADLPAHPSHLAHIVSLTERARGYVEAASSANTRKAYAADWKHFSAWCRRSGLAALPANPQTVGLYITACATAVVSGSDFVTAVGRRVPGSSGRGTKPNSVATIERRLSALSWNYLQRGQILDRKDRHIATVMAGIRNSHAKPPVQKEAVMAEDIIAMLETIDRSSLRGLRDRAMLLIGYAGGLRRSEIVGLDLKPEQTEDGRGWIEIFDKGMLITLRGKTGWREVEIGRGSSDTTCPVVAVQTWIRFAKLAHGPLFRRVTGRGKEVGADRLNDKQIARLVKRTVEAAGIRGDLGEVERVLKFSGHSLRAGLASSAEVDERYVQKQLGHASAEMTRRYQRRRDRFRVNLSKAAGL